MEKTETFTKLKLPDIIIKNDVQVFFAFKKHFEYFNRKNGSKNKYRNICTRSRMHIKTVMDKNRCEQQPHYIRSERFHFVIKHVKKRHNKKVEEAQCQQIPTEIPE